jgi:DnaJ-class molecular chaperone
MKYLSSSFSVGGYDKAYIDKHDEVFGERLRPGDCKRCGGDGRKDGAECDACAGTGRASWVSVDANPSE